MFVFCLVVVEEALLYTTTSLGLFCWLCFVVGVCFGLLFGCASCHKQHLVNRKRKKAYSPKVYLNPKTLTNFTAPANVVLVFPFAETRGLFLFG
jgi:hypothetical protein